MPEELTGGLPDSTYTYMHYLKKTQRIASTCFFMPTSSNEVFNVINGLSNSGSLDFYYINSKIVKATADIISPFLASLYNKCFVCGTFPKAFKISRVTAVFKKGDPDQLGNYRPISIIPVFGKIFEVLINTRLQRFFDTEDVITDRQFGFREMRSAVQAVREVIKCVVNAFEAGEAVSASLLDLSRAFDCVEHSILLNKLEHWGIRGAPMQLMSSYLTGRCQYVRVDGVLSAPKRVQRGVPQGSILGPLLFILYTSDFAACRGSGACDLYADDTTLIDTASDSLSLPRVVGDTVEGALDWFLANRLKANSDKTQSIVFRTKRSTQVSVRLLGIVLDDTLSWGPHLAYLSGKLASTVYLLRSLRDSIDVGTLVGVYHALFGSRVTYGVSLWGGSSDSIVVFRLQKWALRTIARVDRRTHCRPFFIQFRILTVPSLYILHSLAEVHRVADSFTRQSEVHDHGTRSSHLIRTRRFRLDKSTRNSLDLGLYNALPTGLKELSYCLFCSSLKRLLLGRAFYTVREFRDYLSAAVDGPLF